MITVPRQTMVRTMVSMPRPTTHMNVPRSAASPSALLVKLLRWLAFVGALVILALGYRARTMADRIAAEDAAGWCHIAPHSIPRTAKAVQALGPSPRGITDGEWNFAYRDVPVRCPGPMEVLLLASASTVNPTEWTTAQYQSVKGLGMDVSGTVVAVGAGCEAEEWIPPQPNWRFSGYARPAFRLGDEVWGNTADEFSKLIDRDCATGAAVPSRHPCPTARQHGLATFVNVSRAPPPHATPPHTTPLSAAAPHSTSRHSTPQVYCDRVGKRSPGSPVSLADMGTLPTVAGTSYGALRNAGAPWGAAAATSSVAGGPGATSTTTSNVTVLVTSGSGGTGTMAVQMARALGAARVITAASPAHNDALYALGASRVIDYHGLRSAYDALPDASVDVIWDNYGYVRRPP